MVIAVTGHYGSGKTEFAINLALQRRGERRVFLADLDIVNPYFCSRERKAELERLGIEVIVSLGGMQIDIPALPPEILTLFEPDIIGVMDVGGDPVGARVLARYEKQFQKTPYELLCVINANRPETNTADKAVAYLRAIEESSKLKVTGLVNNTHLLQETDAGEINKGLELCNAVAGKTGIPLRYNAVDRRLFKQARDIPHLFLMDIFMKKPWED
ncbi:MAG: ATP-binding protein [Clostridia bacterium]|nr:ATP-binding protein [Clostridia bacterium]